MFGGMDEDYKAGSMFGKKKGTETFSDKGARDS